MSKLFNWVLLLSPIWFLATQNNPDIFGGQRLFMQASVCMLIGALHFNRWIGVFVLVCGAHYFVFDVPLFDTKITDIMCGAVLYHFVATRYKSQGYRWVIFGLLAFTIFLSALQALKIDILFWQNVEPSGTWTLPSYMGIFSAITAPVMLSLNPGAVVLNLIVLAYSKSSFSVLAFAVGLIPFFNLSWRKMAILCVFGVLGIGAYLVSDKKSGEWDRRFNVWPMVLSTAFRSPFFGSGLGNYEAWRFIEFRGRSAHWFQVKIKPENEEATKQEILRIAKLEGTDTSRIETIHFKEKFAPFINLKDIMDDLRGKPENPIHGYVWNHPHNEFIMLFFEFGIFGLWILRMFYVDFFRRFYKIRKTDEIKGLFGAFLALLVVCIAHFPLHVPRLAVPIIFLTALLDQRLKENSERTSK